MWNLVGQYRSRLNEGRLVNQIEIVAGTTTQKLTNAPAFPVSVGAGGLFSRNRLLLYYFKVGLSPSKKICVLFAWLKALWKWWQKLFILS